MKMPTSGRGAADGEERPELAPATARFRVCRKVQERFSWKLNRFATRKPTIHTSVVKRKLNGVPGIANSDVAGR